MKRIVITGGNGLVGTAIKNISINYNYEFIYLSSKDCDLRNYQTTLELFNN